LKFLIVGLGNIGDEYNHTRHNIGFDIVDHLAKEKEASFVLDRLAFVCEVKHKSRYFHLIKPTTYMNLSGKAVRYWMDKLNIPISNILIVVDDLALPTGTLRLRPKGSDAGHNGLKSINLNLGTTDFPRLRVGIGNDFPKGRQVDYVLGKWKDEEWKIMEEKFDTAAEMILSFGAIGIAQTMNQFNK